MTTMTTTLVPVSRNQRLVLKNASLDQLAEELLGAIPVEESPTEFPALPAPLNAPKEIRDALKTLSRAFNGTVVTERRSMNEEEKAAIGEEYEALKGVLALLAEREEQIKEIVRTHQDVEAEEKGLAFPRDVVLNGNVVAKATPRDKDGHYILASKGNPQKTEIPGSTMVFSNQFASGRVIKNLGWIEEAYVSGEIDEATYKACTVTKRVPTAERVRQYVLKSGRTDLLAKVVKRGANHSSMYLRPLKQK